MGMDIRELSYPLADTLPDRLREAGFEIEVVRDFLPEYPEVVSLIVTCRRNENVQQLLMGPSAYEPDKCWIRIPRGWAWRTRVRLRKEQFREEVTAIIDQAGGYMPRGHNERLSGD